MHQQPLLRLRVCLAAAAASFAAAVAGFAVAAATAPTYSIFAIASCAASIGSVECQRRLLVRLR